MQCNTFKQTIISKNKMDIQAKYRKLTTGKRISHGMIWVTNPGMNQTNEANDTEPVLIDIPEGDLDTYKEQGYIKFVPEAPAPTEAKKEQGYIKFVPEAPAPTEAKKAVTPKQ